MRREASISAPATRLCSPSPALLPPAAPLALKVRLTAFSRAEALSCSVRLRVPNSWRRVLFTVLKLLPPPLTSSRAGPTFWRHCRASRALVRRLSPALSPKLYRSGPGRAAGCRARLKRVLFVASV
jgi:hypothetical protein